MTNKKVIRNLWLKSVEMTSTSGQDEIPGKTWCLPSHLEQEKNRQIYETIVCKMLDVRQWKTVKLVRWAFLLPQTTALEWSPDHSTEGLVRRRRPRWESTKNTVAKADTIEYQRGWSCTKREPWKVPGVLINPCVWGNYWSWRKNLLKRLNTGLSNWDYKGIVSNACSHQPDKKTSRFRGFM